MLTATASRSWCRGLGAHLRSLSSSTVNWAVSASDGDGASRVEQVLDGLSAPGGFAAAAGTPEVRQPVAGAAEQQAVGAATQQQADGGRRERRQAAAALSGEHAQQPGGRHARGAGQGQREDASHAAAACLYNVGPWLLREDVVSFFDGVAALPADGVRCGGRGGWHG